MIFIDEIHELTELAVESLYTALEDGHVDLPLPERGRTRP